MHARGITSGLAKRELDEHQTQESDQTRQRVNARALREACTRVSSGRAFLSRSRQEKLPITTKLLRTGKLRATCTRETIGALVTIIPVDQSKTPVS